MSDTMTLAAAHPALQALDAMIDQPLALLGGPVALPSGAPEHVFHWPVVTSEDETAVLEVLRAGSMSGTAITGQFEIEYAASLGVAHCLATCNGTAALLAAMWACGVGAGDEVICPSMTYWASAAPALQLGATVHFCDVDPLSLCLDPADLEHRIGPRTRAIVVVHYAGHPADMDPIMAIARRHGVKVIEDVSHAHGALYRGRVVGTMGDVAAMSMMAGKAFAIGEGGMIATNDRALFERCVCFGHYERMGSKNNWSAVSGQVTDPELKRFAGIPFGGAKHRMNQTASAMGRVQLRHYPARMLRIQNAMNRFWDLLDGTPGIRAHRPADPTSTMGGWYIPRGLYVAQELGGLPLARFCEAVRAEGYSGCGAGANGPLHVHPYFHEADIFHQGAPTAVAFGQRDVRQGVGTLPVTERINDIAFSVPWFKEDDAPWIAQYAAIFRKVALRAASLL